MIFALAGCTAEPAATGVVPTGAAPATPRAGAAPRTITILGSGDVLLHPDLWAQAKRDGGGRDYDFGPLFGAVRPLIESSDLAICHLETPVAPPGGPFRGYPNFLVPPQIITELRELGYDTCSTASNHSLDGGQDGIKRTLDAFDRIGLAHTGTARTAAERAKPNLLDVRGVKIAQLSYTYGFNGMKRPAGKEWIANLIDADEILAEAHRARAAGAGIVVVSLHWGTEYAHQPSSAQVNLARKLLASPDIDLILGCHAHVVQPMSKINGKWVAYGMGNQVAHHADPINANREGIMPRFAFTETSPGHWTATSAEAIPVWMQLDPDRLTLPAPGSAPYKRITALGGVG
ncbi:poly-gamma-glutamate synthesis protein (capsule biosynthesis protein) [Allocatelliglobosispora scoriae]|uniref:Poly-gamma-glutamate synthesis protein (Capsule biosynthesis protein) n=1 Tax=Allocatelliglobosispora scoriae TaxID=643052 RepID=A0A841BWC4_9ACTN|nr:poly-gamma-glutamate synthesis protein (capsule biosynthesis protein) [Allocatelliglobosispora scoriae]